MSDARYGGKGETAEKKRVNTFILKKTLEKNLAFWAANFLGLSLNWQLPNNFWWFPVLQRTSYSWFLIDAKAKKKNAQDMKTKWWDFHEYFRWETKLLLRSNTLMRFQWISIWSQPYITWNDTDKYLSRNETPEQETEQDELRVSILN